MGPEKGSDGVWREPDTDGRTLHVYQPVVGLVVEPGGKIISITRARFSYAYHVEGGDLVEPAPGNALLTFSYAGFAATCTLAEGWTDVELIEGCGFNASLGRVERV